MADKYALKAKVNDATCGMAALIEKVGTKKSAENDQIKKLEAGQF